MFLSFLFLALSLALLDNRSSTEGSYNGWSHGLWHLQGKKEERRFLYSACQLSECPKLTLLLLFTWYFIIAQFVTFLYQYECQYCQYHVKAQYKKMSSKRAELQSSFTGPAPGKGKGRGSLKERLCQSDFHYGGMSSLACAPSVWVHVNDNRHLPFKSTRTLKLRHKSLLTGLPHSQRNNPLFSLFWHPSQPRNLVKYVFIVPAIYFPYFSFLSCMFVSQVNCLLFFV